MLDRRVSTGFYLHYEVIVNGKKLILKIKIMENFEGDSRKI